MDREMNCDRSTVFRDEFLVGVYDETKGWDNHAISHRPSSTIFKKKEQEKTLIVHRASGKWGFKPKCDFSGVEKKLS